MKYEDPDSIGWEDKRLWEPWANCHGVADNEPWDFLLLFGEGVVDVSERERVNNPKGWNSAEAQQRQFTERYCLAGCVVREQCLRWAESQTKWEAGVFGGLTESQRRERRRALVKGRAT